MSLAAAPILTLAVFADGTVRSACVGSDSFRMPKVVTARSNLRENEGILVVRVNEPVELAILVNVRIGHG